MKKGLTEMVFILDRSGSMAGYEDDAIGGFNSMIERQREVDGEAYVSTVLFSNCSKVIHDRENLRDVLPLTKEEYHVGGSTALIDAIGDAIHHIKNVHKYARKEDVPEKTVFVIMTDGYENSSNHWTSDDVKGNIAEQEQNGWEFIFLGADIDAVETGESMGVRSSRCANYKRENARAMSMYASDRLADLRECGELVEPIDIAFKLLNEEELAQMDARSRKLEQRANEKAQKSVKSAGGDTKNN